MSVNGMIFGMVHEKGVSLNTCSADSFVFLSSSVKDVHHQVGVQRGWKDLETVKWRKTVWCVKEQPQVCTRKTGTKRQILLRRQATIDPARAMAAVFGLLGSLYRRSLYTPETSHAFLKKLETSD